VLPWQQYRRCHSVSFVVRICGAGFEEHCSNVSGDVLDLVFCCSGGTTYDIITFLICIIQNVNISGTREDVLGGEAPFFLALVSLSDRQRLFFAS